MLHFTLSRSSDITGCQCLLSYLLFCLLFNFLWQNRRTDLLVTLPSKFMMRLQRHQRQSSFLVLRSIIMWSHQWSYLQTPKFYSLGLVLRRITKVRYSYQIDDYRVVIKTSHGLSVFLDLIQFKLQVVLKIMSLISWFLLMSLQSLWFLQLKAQTILRY